MIAAVFFGKTIIYKCGALSQGENTNFSYVLQYALPVPSHPKRVSKEIQSARLVSLRKKNVKSAGIRKLKADYWARLLMKYDKRDGAFL